MHVERRTARARASTSPSLARRERLACPRCLSWYSEPFPSRVLRRACGWAPRRAEDFRETRTVLPIRRPRGSCRAARRSAPGRSRCRAASRLHPRASVAAVWVSGHCGAGHADVGRVRQAFLHVAVVRLAVRKTQSPAIVVHHDLDMVRVVEGRGCTVECGLIELPRWRRRLPDETRELAAVFLVQFEDVPAIEPAEFLPR